MSSYKWTCATPLLLDRFFNEHNTIACHVTDDFVSQYQRTIVRIGVISLYESTRRVNIEFTYQTIRKYIGSDECAIRHISDELYCLQLRSLIVEA